MKPYYADEAVALYHGKCEYVLREIPDASVDAVATDPPYELGFMGKGWDATGIAYSVDLWRECLRVLKPGGHLLAFGGSRTWHRLASAVEDAGFEIRDSIAWLYGSGFPKSLDVSKAIDKRRDDRPDIVRVTSWLKQQAGAAGITRAAVDAHLGTSDMGGWWLTDLPHRCAVPTWDQWLQLRDLIGFGDEMDAEVWRLNGRKGTPGEAWEQREVVGTAYRVRRESTVQIVGLSDGEYDVTAPATEPAQRWQGWGTALKPAFEPIVVARKPLVGTVAANVLTHGTGALNIDGCRVGGGERPLIEADYKATENSAYAGRMNGSLQGGSRNAGTTSTGRWPTNVVLDDTQAAEVDRQSGVLTSGKMQPTHTTASRSVYGQNADGGYTTMETYGDSGGASRFFPVFRYEAKAPTSERPRDGEVAHPTVKPLDLMRWLVRLVTPPGGTVLEPFAGSGTTAEACVIEGFRCIAIEREADYLPLIVNRLSKPIQIGLDFEGTAS